MSNIQPPADEPLNLPRHGSVVAAAGCGKTEQIVLAIKGAPIGRRLVLTHTHAGVHALQKRFTEHKVPANSYRVDTLAGWCLRYVSSYPQRSGFKLKDSTKKEFWPAVYAAALQLFDSRAVDRVLCASYEGVLIDEYQDCTEDQHAVVSAIARVLPLCVFGDYMQSIFNFGEAKPVDWMTQVRPRFPEAGKLTYAWRWRKVENSDLAVWLEQKRIEFEEKQPLDFTLLPACVTWTWLPSFDGPKRQAVLAACKKAMNLEGRLIVIGDPTNLAGRAAIAKDLAKLKFSNIEPLSSPSAFAFAKKFDSKKNETRFSATLDLIKNCMSGLNRTPFEAAVTARRQGEKLGDAKFGHLVNIGLTVCDSGDPRSCLDLLNGFASRQDCFIYRHELLATVRLALTSVSASQFESLTDALHHIQTRIRHSGRQIRYRSIGSTLLVKGLEFENSVIVHSANMGYCDWYVALTRATKTVSILSPHKVFSP